MRNLINSAKGSAWLTTLIVVAIIIAVVLIVGNTNLVKDNSIQGLVSSVNHEGQFLILSEVVINSVDEEGNADITETEYVVVWGDDSEITPHHPSLLEGGEIIKVTPNEDIDEDNYSMFSPKTLEILEGAPVEEEVIEE